MSPFIRLRSCFYVTGEYHSCQNVTDVDGFSVYWSRCHLVGDVITTKSSLVVAEIMGCQDGK